MKDRQLLQQALDALENVTEDYVESRQYKHNKAITALRERLAQPEQPEPPPECKTDEEKTAFAFGWLKAMEAQRLAQPEQEPVEWVPVTETLLHEQHSWLYKTMWIAMKDGRVLRGRYEWRQGRNPDRFYADGAGDEWAYDASHVMPSQAPAHPSTTPPAAAHMTEFEEAVAAVDNTLHHAIDHWQDKASEQAALLRECRAALDSLIEKPELAALLCGSTTLGNLRASLHDYRVKGIFDDTPPAAQRQPQYNKTEMNCFVQNLYDEKMREGKHGHYETMFHVVHRAIEAAHGIKENT